MNRREESEPFPYEAVYAALDREAAQPGRSRNVTGEADPGERTRTYTDRQILQLFREVFRWLILGSHLTTDGSTRTATRRKREVHGIDEGTPNRSLARVADVHVSGTRAMAGAWILLPELFDGGSLSDVGRLPRVQRGRKVLCAHAKDFEDAFGVHCRAMRTEANREQLSEAQRKRWQKRKAAARRARAKEKVLLKAARAIANSSSAIETGSKAQEAGVSL